MRTIYISSGFLLIALGVIGAFLPVMPTTIFIILAAGCFAKSSPRMEKWILDHPRFGPAVIAWREDRSMSIGAKVAATFGMSIGALGVGLAPMVLWAKIIGWLIVAVCLIYVLTRRTQRKQG